MYVLILVSSKDFGVLQLPRLPTIDVEASVLPIHLIP